MSGESKMGWRYNQFFWTCARRGRVAVLARSVDSRAVASMAWRWCRSRGSHRSHQHAVHPDSAERRDSGDAIAATPRHSRATQTKRATPAIVPGDDNVGRRDTRRDPLVGISDTVFACVHMYSFFKRPLRR